LLTNAVYTSIKFLLKIEKVIPQCKPCLPSFCVNVPIHSHPFRDHSKCKVLPNKDHAMCGKERFIGIQTTLLPHPQRSGSSGLDEMSGMFYRRGQAMEEGESFWSLIIYDH
jgi:hypothetical protein